MVHTKACEFPELVLSPSLSDNQCNIVVSHAATLLGMYNW